MGIKPLGSQPYTPPPADTVENRMGGTTNELEDTGAKVGEGLAEIDAKASSANTGMSELSKRVSALEKQSTPPDLTGYPLFLWWDGTGTKPPLKPGWALININTGKVEKG